MYRVRLDVSTAILIPHIWETKLDDYLAYVAADINSYKRLFVYNYNLSFEKSKQDIYSILKLTFVLVAMHLLAKNAVI